MWLASDEALDARGVIGVVESLKLNPKAPGLLRRPSRIARLGAHGVHALRCSQNWSVCVLFPDLRRRRARPLIYRFIVERRPSIRALYVLCMMVLFVLLVVMCGLQPPTMVLE